MNAFQVIFREDGRLFVNFPYFRVLVSFEGHHYLLPAPYLRCSWSECQARLLFGNVMPDDLLVSNYGQRSSLLSFPKSSKMCVPGSAPFARRV